MSLFVLISCYPSSPYLNRNWAGRLKKSQVLFLDYALHDKQSRSLTYSNHRYIHKHMHT
jgi:hypothetical protein